MERLAESHILLRGHKEGTRDGEKKEGWTGLVAASKQLHDGVAEKERRGT